MLILDYIQRVASFFLTVEIAKTQFVNRELFDGEAEEAELETEVKELKFSSLRNPQILIVCMEKDISLGCTDMWDTG